MHHFKNTGFQFFSSFERSGLDFSPSLPALIKNFVLFTTVIFSSTGFCGMRNPPFPHAITSTVGMHVLTMVPKTQNPESEGFGSGKPIKIEGVGKCYRVNQDGTLSLAWKVEGWYSENLVLSDDGNSLVRLGSWQSGDQDSGEIGDSLAIEFYYKGKKVKSYRIKDLIIDETKLIPTTAGIIWVLDGGFQLDQKSFYLKTVDGNHHRFSLPTGEVIEEEISEGQDSKQTSKEKN